MEPNQLHPFLLITMKKTRQQIHRLIPTDMKERHYHGLCYNYDDKWALGHSYLEVPIIFWLRSGKNHTYATPLYLVAYISR